MGADPVIVGRMAQRCEALTPLANNLGKRVHEWVKAAACSQDSVLDATVLGVLIARQVLSETIGFARKSMDGDVADERAVADAARQLFDLIEGDCVEAVPQ